MAFRFDEFTADEQGRQLLRAGHEVHLSPKAFDLLIALLRASPRALAKVELHATLWPDTFGSDANLSMLVTEIRRAIGDDARAPRFVRTVQRHGYAFQGIVTEVTDRDVEGWRFQCWILPAGRQVPLQPGENIVGRDPKAQVWLDSNGVSRRHARIVVGVDAVTIEDLNSKNGTRVGGRSVTGPVRLTDGDQVAFGSTSVTYRVSSVDQTTQSEKLQDTSRRRPPRENTGRRRP